MRRLPTLVALLLAAGCHDLTVPPVPTLRPGIVRATLLTAQPGRADLRPAVGATVRLLGTTLQASADGEGNVALTDLRSTQGQLLFEFDSDRDGQADRTRIISLEAAAAGFGKDVNLGQLVLGRNATLVGRVLREDRAELSSGHGGVAIFLPELPQLTLSGDDGSYVLRGVPEGALIVSFTTTGYRPEATSVSVSSSEEQRVGTVVLVADPGAAPIGQLSGLVREPDGTPIAAVQVRAAARGQEFSSATNAEGRFAFPSLSTGVYVLGLEKSGLQPLRVDGVLVASGLNETGPYVMTPGQGTLGPLDGGPMLTADAGALPDAGPQDAGQQDAGSTDGGQDAGVDAGALPDAGEDDAGSMGPLPVAIVSGFQLAAPGAQATLDGTASTGAQPLRYSWRELTDAGVTLSANDSAIAHSPTFTVPALGALLEFSLVVTDRFGRPSTNSAVALVGVGRTPQARFGPDADTFLGADRLNLVSTSFDDAGLLITAHDWRQVPAVAGAVLVSDGGPTAFLTLPPLMPGDAPVVVGVELSVTNSVGARSPVFRQSYSAIPGSSSNWSLNAALVGSTPILSTGTNPPVRLDATVTTSVQSPSISYAWSCPSLGSALTPLSGGDVEFAVPVIQGADRTVTCTLTATGAAPLNPGTLQANVGFTLSDDVNPSLVTARPNSGLTRATPFGGVLRFSEPIASLGFVPLNSVCGAVPTEQVGNGIVIFSEQWLANTSCSAITVNATDRATVPNLATIPVSPIFSLDYDWRGPLLSTADFADPRPAVTSAGALPFDLQALSPPSAPVLPYELVAREGTNLVTFGPDFFALPACSPDCALSGTQTALPGLDPAVPAPLGERVAYSDQELFVALQRAQDAGILDTVYARRSPAGTWSAMSIPGELHNSGTELRRMRLVNGGLVSDVFDRTTSTFVFPEQVLADAGTNIISINTSQARPYASSDVSIFRSSGTLDSYRRNAGSASWFELSHFKPTNALYGRTFPNADGIGAPTLAFGFVVRSTPDHMMGFDGSARAVNTLGPVTGGYDFVQRGLTAVVAVSQNGDLRLYRGRVSSGAMPAVGPVPRAVPLAPGDNRIDIDPSCEAAWPRLAFIEDALVVTWQERCAPSTRWKVAARVVR